MAFLVLGFQENEKKERIGILITKLIKQDTTEWKMLKEEKEKEKKINFKKE